MGIVDRNEVHRLILVFDRLNTEQDIRAERVLRFRLAAPKAAPPTLPKSRFSNRYLTAL